MCHLMDQITPKEITGFLFGTSGTDANEAAVRIARLYTKKHKIFTRYRSYHGGSAMTLGLTGKKSFNI